ncbi:hypothetical protein D3C77_485290 [compost metagenome]
MKEAPSAARSSPKAPNNSSKLSSGSWSSVRRTISRCTWHGRRRSICAPSIPAATIRVGSLIPDSCLLSSRLRLSCAHQRKSNSSRSKAALRRNDSTVPLNASLKLLVAALLASIVTDKSAASGTEDRSRAFSADLAAQAAAV